MARKTTKSKTYHKKNYRKKRYNKKRNVLTLRSGTIIPDTYRTKLIYSQIVSFTSGSFPYDTEYYIANSVYQPDPINNAGVRPPGYNNLMALYNNWRVMGSSCQLNIVNTDTTLPVLICLYPTDSVYSPTTQAAMLSQAYSKNKVMSLAAGQPSAILKTYMSTAKIQGIKDVYNDEQNIGSIATNPNRLWYWNVGYGHPTGANAATIAGTVKITYYVEFFNRDEANMGS